MPSYKELVAQREALEQKIKAARDSELAEAIAQARSLVAEYGLQESDVFAKRGATGTRKATGPVAPKYRDPATGATWTGRGKPPLWIAGKERAQFAI